MDLTKLFRLLVVGGAVIAGAPSCGPEDAPSTGANGGGAVSTTDASTATDGGVPNDGTGGGVAGTGGGVNFW